MKKLMVSLMAGAMSLAAMQAMAADAVTLQLKWVAQGQFGGYFVAQVFGALVDHVGKGVQAFLDSRVLFAAGFVQSPLQMVELFVEE